jgi:protease-4
MKLFAGLVAVAVVAFSVGARAQGANAGVPTGEPPTPGVYNPTLGVAGDADASAIEKDPAGLGFLRGWSGVYLHSELDEDGRVPGRGDGFFLAARVPYLSAFSVGTAVQLIRPPQIFTFANEAKFSLALSWRPLSALAFGLHYAHLWASKGPVAGGLDTLDLAFSTRIGRYVAAAMVVHDVPSPTVAGVPLQRVYEPEIALRPFGYDVLELALAARFGERRGDVDPRVRMWVTPAPGVHLKCDLEVRRDWDLDGTIENDVRVALGLQLDFERFGVAGFGLFGSDSGTVRGHGFTVAARISGERYPTFWKGPARFEKIDLGPGMTGRKLIAELVHLRRLERAREIAGVVVVLGALDGGWATAEELRAALLRLRHAKKHVYVYLVESTTRGYYVASAGERLYQDPAGGVRLVGLSSTVTFFKGTADLLGVRADFVKIAEYKSAPEQYTRASSSDPARAQREALLGDVYHNLVQAIAAGRGVDEARVRGWIDKGPYTAPEALAAGLVDELKGGDEVEGAIAERLGRHVALVGPPSGAERARTWERPRIAVLVIDGDLTEGKSLTIPLLDLRFSGMQTLLPAIEHAREDPRVKALVVRVDSPGGSALASDLIARELERTRAHKPVVCSFGDTAASGGYFVAAPCQRIFAAPSTLTGSIGIFTGKFDVSGLAAKLGVTFELYERGAHASIESLWRSYTDEERRLILEKLGYYYRRFVDAVARGRGLSVEAVDALGRGHVWSGRAALARRLVDEFGGLGDALGEAKGRAGLGEETEVDVELLPEEPSLLGQLASLLGLSLKAGAEPLTALPGLADVLRALPGSLLLEPSTPQARLDAQIVIN